MLCLYYEKNDSFDSSKYLTVKNQRVASRLIPAIGVGRIWYALKCKMNNWAWLLAALSGLLNIALAIIILATLPASAVWVIGLLVVMEMLLSGWAILWLGLRARRLAL
jgi:uncharacterized membrane protein HdeD (DUF308 family)